jgi:hypothetical protein
MPRTARFPRLSAEEALAALKWLHTTRKVTAKEILTAVRGREKLVAEIRERLERLGGDSLRFLRGPEVLRLRPRRRRASAKARKAWADQGRYIAAVRVLSKADRAKVRAIRAKSGVGAAIAAARRLQAG